MIYVKIFQACWWNSMRFLSNKRRVLKSVAPCHRLSIYFGGIPKRNIPACGRFIQSSPCSCWAWSTMGALFTAYSILPTPHESPWYPDPLTNLLSPPSSLPCSFSLSILLLLLSCCGHRLSSSSRLLSNNVCIHPPKATHTHTHSFTDTLTPAQTHFEGFPRVRHWSKSSLCSSFMRKIMSAQPVSQSVTQSVCLSVSPSPCVQVCRYIRHSSRMPHSHANRSAGCWTDLKLTLSSRWLAMSGEWRMGLSYHLMRQRILMSSKVKMPIVMLLKSQLGCNVCIVCNPGHYHKSVSLYQPLHLFHSAKPVLIWLKSNRV